MMVMIPMLTVFVCSTYVDLAQERDSVLDAIRRLQLQHDSMEFFGARASQPLETCLEEVRRSNILVVIVGHRYGSIAPEVGVSFSEAEYNEGFRLKKPCLVYMRDEDVPVLPRNVERDPEKLRLLEKWKTTLTTRHTVAPFREANDLAVQVAADIGRTLTELAATEHDRKQQEWERSGVWQDIRRLVDSTLERGVSETAILRTVSRSLRALSHEPATVVFSYAISDRASVKVFRAALEAEGISVWSAEDVLEPGSLWARDIKQSLRVAEFVIFFISTASAASKAVQIEVQHVLSRRVAGEPAPFVIPVLLESAQVPPLLRDVHWINASAGNIGSAVEGLVRAIRSYTNEPTSP